MDERVVLLTDTDYRRSRDLHHGAARQHVMARQADGAFLVELRREVLRQVGHRPVVVCPRRGSNVLGFEPSGAYNPARGGASLSVWSRCGRHLVRVRSSVRVRVRVGLGLELGLAVRPPPGSGLGLAGRLSVGLGCGRHLAAG
eukprot:scaffold19502_cov68-Phaeocystis_antarctica.AAC.2